MKAIQALARKPAACFLLIAFLPVVLRLALLPHHPEPIASGADDFGYLLLSDTLSHLRLANPPHPMHRFFEADFVLQQPSYSSIFPLGQGLVLALGQIVTGHPWAGVLLSEALLCGLCYWMLRAWISPVPALLGGLLAVCEFGPLNQWMNTYWGGAVPAVAGCLVLGALPRIARKKTLGIWAVLGLGLGLEWLTRPFEFTLLAVSVAVYLLLDRRGASFRTLAIAILPILGCFGLSLFHNHAVTGSWPRLPYMESRDQYGVPTTFTFQPIPVPNRPLNREQRLDYEAQSAVHGSGESPRFFLQRLWERLPLYRFFAYPPLYLAWLAFLAQLRTAQFRWILGTVLLFAIGTNFYPYFYPHYVAALTCLFVLMSVAGLETIWLRWRLAGVAILLLCAAQFVFWYGVHLLGNQQWLAKLQPYEAGNFINWGDAEGRRAVAGQLAAVPGDQLVFVHYSPRHMFHAWVHNGAEIDRARTIWANDLGYAENQALVEYYPSRSAWFLEPDVWPPRLTRYVRPSLTPAPSPGSAPARPTHTRASPKPEQGIADLPESGFIRH